MPGCSIASSCAVPFHASLVLALKTGETAAKTLLWMMSQLLGSWPSLMTRSPCSKRRRGIHSAVVVVEGESVARRVVMRLPKGLLMGDILISLVAME